MDIAVSSKRPIDEGNPQVRASLICSDSTKEHIPCGSATLCFAESMPTVALKYLLQRGFFFGRGDIWQQLGRVGESLSIVAGEVGLDGLM